MSPVIMGYNFDQKIKFHFLMFFPLFQCFWARRLVKYNKRLTFTNIHYSAVSKKIAIKLLQFSILLQFSLACYAENCNNENCNKLQIHCHFEFRGRMKHHKQFRIGLTVYLMSPVIMGYNFDQKIKFHFHTFFPLFQCFWAWRWVKYNKRLTFTNKHSFAVCKKIAIKLLRFSILLQFSLACYAENCNNENCNKLQIHSHFE